MPPYAICSTDQCDYVFDFRASDNIPPRFPDRRCPTCSGILVFGCRFCGSMILEVPDKDSPRCWNCTARLRDNQSLAQGSYSTEKSPSNAEGTHNNGVMLSGRELEVLKLLAKGNQNKEIASALGISAKTVEIYRSRVMRKLNAQSVIHLVHYAIRNKIVELQP
jgi:DNA-binding CsgD family transcriptional regulator